MSRIDGPSRRDIRYRGDEYAARFVASIRDTLHTVSAGFHGVVTLDDLTPILREWTRRLDAQLLVDIGQTYADAAHTTRVAQRDELVKLLAANGDALTAAAADDTFEIPSVTDKRALDLMAESRNRLVNVGNDVWEHARGELIVGLHNGESVPELRDRVVGATGLAAPRAETIARTEIAHAMNQGSLDQMRQIDASDMTQEWIAVRDGRTRPEHAAMDGRKVGINERFPIGEPGDEPNCRCTLGYDIPDDKLVSSACDCLEGETPLLASIARTAGIDLGDNLDAVCACETGVGDAYASQATYQSIVDQAQKKIANAPVPSRAAIEKAQIELEKARAGTGRAGGESRGGSAASRRKQRENLFKEFGGEERGYIVCHGCSLKIHWATPGSADNPQGYARFERGKIFVKCQGGGYQLPNLLPECFGCNRSRNDKMIREENKC